MYTCQMVLISYKLKLIFYWSMSKSINRIQLNKRLNYSSRNGHKTGCTIIIDRIPVCMTGVRASAELNLILWYARQVGDSVSFCVWKSSFDYACLTFFIRVQRVTFSIIQYFYSGRRRRRRRRDVRVSSSVSAANNILINRWCTLTFRHDVRMHNVENARAPYSDYYFNLKFKQNLI